MLRSQCTIFIFNLSVFIFGLIKLSAEVNAKKIPDYVPVCKKNSPELEKCILNSIEAVRPYLAKGIPKMKVPPSEPLVIPSLEIVRDLDALKINAKLKDIRAYGPSSFIVKKLKIDIPKLTLEMSVKVPYLYVTSDYDVDGRLMIVPLKGKGHFKGNITNTEAEIKGTGKTVTNKKGITHLEIQTVTSKIKVGDAAVKFINQDKENALIMETAGNFINQNKKQVLQIVKPIIDETTAAFIEQFGNAIFRAVPYSEILPE